MNKLELLFEDFVKSSKFPKINKDGFSFARRTIAASLKSIDEKKISWHLIQKEAEKTKEKKHGARVLVLWVIFLIEIDKNDLLNDQYKGLFAKYEKDITEYALTGFKNKIDVLRDPDVGPCSIVITPRNKEIVGNEPFRAFVIPNLSEQQHNFIIKYLSSLDDELMESRLGRGAINMFSILCKNNCLYTDFDLYNDDTFSEQFNIISQNISSELKFAKQTRREACLGELINLYNWIETSMDEATRKKKFKIYTLATLKFQFFISSMLNGFKVVNYSIHDNPPEFDKMIINPQKSDLHQTAQADKIVSLDLSCIKNIHLRKWVKECYWFDDKHNIINRTKEYRPIFDFVEMIDKQYKKEELPQISVDDILTYKAFCVSTNTQDSTISRKLGIIKYFLNFLNDRKYVNIDQLLFRILIHHDSKKNAYKETYTNEEIKQILAAYKDSYEKCNNPDMKLLYALYYYVIAIQSISEMRISTILNLKIDCLVKTLEHNKQSEYKVIVQSKTSGKDFDEYNITKYVKGLIDEVKNLTEEYRKTITGIEKEYLFIYRRHNRKIPGIVRQDALLSYHKKMCEQYGIRKLHTGAIRNYYQQQVSNYVSENGDDPMLIEKLSKHGINVHIQNYDAIDIQDFCQRFYQVEIGSIELKGRVEEKNDKPKRNNVMRGCGHCELSECVLKGNLDCLMCNKFVTTLDCIPFFESEIQRIDKMILNQPIQHEKEFLNNKKRLNVAYLTKLYELEAELNETN